MNIAALIGIIIGIVVGVALIPNVIHKVQTITTPTYSSSVVSLAGVLVIVFVTVIILGAVAWLGFGEHREKRYKDINYYPENDPFTDSQLQEKIKNDMDEIKKELSGQQEINKQEQEFKDQQSTQTTQIDEKEQSSKNSFKRI